MSHSSSCQNASLYCREVWRVIHINVIPSSMPASYILRTVIRQDLQPKSYRRRIHALPGSFDRFSLLETGCEPYITSCDNALGCLHRIFNNNLLLSVFVFYSRSSPIFVRSPSCRLLQPLSQTMPMSLGLQSPVSLPISQHRFSLSKAPHLIVPTFLLHLVALLGTTFP